MMVDRWLHGWALGDELINWYNVNKDNPDFMTFKRFEELFQGHQYSQDEVNQISNEIKLGCRSDSEIITSQCIQALQEYYNSKATAISWKLEQETAQRMIESGTGRFFIQPGYREVDDMLQMIQQAPAEEKARAQAEEEKYREDILLGRQKAWRKYEKSLQDKQKADAASLPARALRKARSTTPGTPPPRSPAPAPTPQSKITDFFSQKKVEEKKKPSSKKKTPSKKKPPSKEKSSSKGKTPSKKKPPSKEKSSSKGKKSKSRMEVKKSKGGRKMKSKPRSKRKSRSKK
ncbi:MAG: hypothetical protein CMG46_00500 [Candidatus Marinimicrobia bacterium]|nr:hypothetical protein [Candidatus Neomarinimicrobiota bacterium]